MSKSKQTAAKAGAKQGALFDAAAAVFAQYGFKRTTMNDIAEAAGMSRPALYLLFTNKEHLFRELSSYRINLALKAAKTVLARQGSVSSRFIDALMEFERTYSEPVANSPHGAELYDINMSLAADVMTVGYASLVAALAKLLKDAELSGEANFGNTPLTHKAFVELLLASISGIKKKAGTKAEYRKQTKHVAQIFLSAVIT